MCVGLTMVRGQVFCERLGYASFSRPQHLDLTGRRFGQVTDLFCMNMLLLSVLTDWLAAARQQGSRATDSTVSTINPLPAARHTKRYVCK